MMDLGGAQVQDVAGDFRCRKRDPPTRGHSRVGTDLAQGVGSRVLDTGIPRPGWSGLVPREGPKAGESGAGTAKDPAQDPGKDSKNGSLELGF